MKGRPLPFDFEGKGLSLHLFSDNFLLNTNSSFQEPISVLDSPILSSSFASGGGGGGGGGGSGAETTSSSNGGAADDSLNLLHDNKCAMEDWETVLSETTSSPGQEHSIFRWIMSGDVEDPTFNKHLHSQIGAATSTAVDLDGNENQFAANNFMPNFNRSTPMFHNLSNNFNFNILEPPIFNPSSSFHFQQEEHNSNNNPFIPPPAKRSFLDTGQENNNNYPTQTQLNLLHQPYHHHLPQKPKIGNGEEYDHEQEQHKQGIIDQLYKAAESIQRGNLILAQGILARLNQQLSPIGKPFYRAAFYYKEALLQLLLNTSTNSSSTAMAISTNNNNSPFSLVFKIGTYKCFSEVSPLVQFGNFTCNQALLEVFEGYERIHIVDFDIGYGGQWASLMQELALRNGGEGVGVGAPTLKITVFASPLTHDRLELGLTQENLSQFANDINIGFEFDVINVDSLNSSSWSALPFDVLSNEVIAVNLPVGSLANYNVSVPLVLRFVKQLSPRIIVSTDRGCHRTDLPFANHVIDALQSYSNLIESLDSVNMNMDSMQKIERFLLQPEIEKIVIGRFKSPEKTQHWRNLFLASGFAPVKFSNFTETQAECVVKRTPVRGFQVEKRHSSLVLCWQRKELISVSAWRC